MSDSGIPGDGRPQEGPEGFGASQGSNPPREPGRPPHDPGTPPGESGPPPSEPGPPAGGAPSGPGDGSGGPPPDHEAPGPEEPGPEEPSPEERSHEAARAARRRRAQATLIGALGATLVSLVFIASFIGALHAPGPRSVPIGVVGTQTQAAALSDSLDQVRSGGYTVKTYQTAREARDAILDRKVNAAILPTPAGDVLAVATAAGSAVTNATVTDLSAVAQASGAQLGLQNVRPLPPNDPQGISQVFFVVALLAPSLVFANMLVTRFGKAMHPVGQLLAILGYSVIVAAVAVAVADPGIGALTGAPWALFGIGTLLAFAAAATAAAASRWAGGLGYLVVFLLFIPVGIASSGTTLGPHMITQWYADLGRALPAGAALPAVQNAVYFDGNATAAPLLVLSAWAVAAALALALTAFFRPPTLGGRRHRTEPPAADDGAAAPAPQV